MRLLEGIKLDYDDVLLVPQRSSLDSRKDVLLEREYHFLHAKRSWSGIGIIAANMDTTGSFSMAKKMAQHKMLTALHKHYSVEEFISLEKYLGSRKIKGGIEFWVFTSRKTYDAIKKKNLLEKIERSGVKIFTDGCSLQYPKKSWNFTCAMSDSVKYANYCFSQTGLNVLFSGTRDCVETAISGELRISSLWK